jgi:hypothetical protein
VAELDPATGNTSITQLPADMGDPPVRRLAEHVLAATIASTC